jgi:hypothetical protein
VRRIAADRAGRGADDLSAVNTAEMPVETHALGVALTGLLARHADVLARERRFTADSSVIKFGIGRGLTRATDSWVLKLMRMRNL